MKCWKTAAVLVVTQVVCGVILTGITLYTASLTPLLLRDCPLWASVPLTVAGISGIVFIFGCKRRYGSEISVFASKVASGVLCSIAMIACFIASVFLILHVILYINQYYSCEDKAGLHCLCRKGDSLNNFVHIYENITCLTVKTDFRVLLAVMAAFSIIGGFACTWYVTLLWSGQYEHIYAGIINDEAEVTNDCV